MVVTWTCCGNHSAFFDIHLVEPGAWSHWAWQSICSWTCDINEEVWVCCSPGHDGRPSATSGKAFADIPKIVGRPVTHTSHGWIYNYSFWTPTCRTQPNIWHLSKIHELSNSAVIICTFSVSTSEVWLHCVKTISHSSNQPFTELLSIQPDSRLV